MNSAPSQPATAPGTETKTETENEAHHAPWALSPAAALQSVDASPAGLSSSQAEQRIRTHGPNELTPTAIKPAWRRFIAHFDNVLIYILLAAGVLKAIAGDWVDFTVIIVVAVANALIGFIQEGRSRDALASLRTILKNESAVLRDHEWAVLEVSQIVPGDIVRIASGDRVPADLRLISATNLTVDEAALTGESEPANKDIAPVGTDAGVGDRSSMLHSGTIITTGNGEGVVVSTGANTEIGQISTLVSEMEVLETPLSRQLTALAKYLSIAIGLMAAIMLIIGRVLHNFEFDELLSAAIGFAVAAVPEGLPALVTITMAMGVQQMARRNAITRNMGAVETLGAVTVICSDKTGTLTQNEMTARTVVTNSATYAVTGTGYTSEGALQTTTGQPANLADHPDLAALVLTAGICNDSRIEPHGTGWRVIGQPTEGALNILATKAGAQIADIIRLSQVPFESTHKFSATLDQFPDGARAIHVVGAPDRLLDRASSEIPESGSNQPVPLRREVWDARIDELSGQGLRVLAAAYRPADSQADEITLESVENGLIFLGVVGIVDPPRPEVAVAIQDTHSAGIKVKMITGDHVGTATAIARELGIAPAHGKVAALTGADLERMSQEELRTKVQAVDVYARTSPEHKLRIVRALQSHGEVVAMTGDGVNDAPSITRANVGVAMGIKGTEATKDAADIVLADDNFATIAHAVEEGRRIYDNIRKSVVFLLPTNGAQSLVILVAVLLGLALPLSPVQILWVNLITAVTLSFALVNEPAETGVMNRPPRAATEQVLSRQSWLMVLVASVFIGGAALVVYLMESTVPGGSYAMAQTTAVTMLVMGQIAFLFSCRFLNSSSLTWKVLTGNPALWISIGVLICAQLIFTYTPFMNAWFGSIPIGLREWGITLALGIALFFAFEFGKLLLQRLVMRRRSWLAHRANSDHG